MSHDLLHDLPDGPILLCAGTDTAGAARLAEAAASLLTDRPVLVLATWEAPPMVGGLDAVMDALYDAHADLRTAARRTAAEAAGAACELLDARGLDVTRRVVADERTPWHAILDVAEEIDAAVIVVGAGDGTTQHQGGLGRETRALAHRSRRPLLVLPDMPHAADPAAIAFFAYDGSPSAGTALRAGARLLMRRPALAACAWQTATYAVGVAMLAVPDEVARKGAAGLDESSRREAEAHAHDAAQRLGEAGWACETAAIETARSIPGAIILAAEEHDAAVIVTGTRGRSRIAAALLGSSAEGIVRHAGRPVLLVPPLAEKDH